MINSLLFLFIHTLKTSPVLGEVPDRAMGFLTGQAIFKPLRPSASSPTVRGAFLCYVHSTSLNSRQPFPRR